MITMTGTRPTDGNLIGYLVSYTNDPRHVAGVDWQGWENDHPYLKGMVKRVYALSESDAMDIALQTLVDIVSTVDTCQLHVVPEADPLTSTDRDRIDQIIADANAAMERAEKQIRESKQLPITPEADPAPDPTPQPNRVVLITAGDSDDYHIKYVCPSVEFAEQYIEVLREAGQAYTELGFEEWDITTTLPKFLVQYAKAALIPLDGKAHTIHPTSKYKTLRYPDAPDLAYDTHKNDNCIYLTVTGIDKELVEYALEERVLQLERSLAQANEARLSLEQLVAKNT